MTVPNEPPVLTATYRLQLHAGFAFDDARAVLPYLADLGITHVYLSPITTAAPGSTHGYDVADPTRINPEFDGEEGYARFVQEQRRLGLGQVIDVVPNHFGIPPGAANPFWDDVLRQGPSAYSAPVFDIDWEPLDESLRGRVMLPILGDRLDAVLARGELTVEVEGDLGWLRYYAHRLPINPPSLDVWRAAGAPRDTAAVRALIEAQHYRLGYWRDTKRLVNYRRFFTVDSLIGIRTEDPNVFEFVHRLALRLVREGSAHGLRIDHPDGLLDPKAYLDHLRSALTEAGAPEAYVVLENILDVNEPLPENWDCAGTTGYDFLNEVTRVLVARDHEARFTEVYEGATGRRETYRDVEDACRADIVRGYLGGQLDTIAHRLHRAAGEGTALEAFVEAFRRLLSAFPIYRSYHRVHALDPYAASAVAHAVKRVRDSGDVDAAALERVASILAAPPEGEARANVMRLQQFMPAIQAKGLEDRAFYRYYRLLALNEVGGDPGRFGEPVEAFHTRLGRKAHEWPAGMLATATHDHKRGEDVRARLIALSELPDEWGEAYGRAAAALRRFDEARDVSEGDLYFLVQTLIGCMPAGMEGGREGDRELIERLDAYMRKALRESGEHTDWVATDERYEDAVGALIRHSLAEGSPVLEALAPLLTRVARLGAVTSLAQVALKIGGPGVTDVYQGNELWDFTLVDPDNRRAVDFEHRRRLLDALRPALEDGRQGDAARRERLPALLEGWRDGGLKAFVLARGLQVRRAHPALFVGGDYEPLQSEGERAGHVVAFARRDEVTSAILAVPRQPGALLDGADGAFWQPDWRDTTLHLPQHLEETAWRDAFTGTRIEPGARLPLAHVLGDFPVALLLSEAGPST
ncbi:MAG: malto-oligosyltrehalose synthase [Acidimicrobiia bacterium]